MLWKPCTRTSLVAAAAFLACFAAQAAPTKTIANLKAAYVGETTASVKYAVYAKKAKAEGYEAVSALFTAASFAERVHAANHKAALASYGVKNPVRGAFTAKSGTTSANLKDAIKGETYEKDVMYPGFLKIATAEHAQQAVTTFRYALSAEKQHAALYTAALSSLSDRKVGLQFFVCPVCGATFESAAPYTCPVCMTPAEKFRMFE